ncbi:MAG TPA: methyl-accepting chemotaxis protein [Steroidobacteraceae bacterium]|nr:methyl-accepting chemotaxis protein [Steroidobacteraceae bacterium]
MAKQSEVATVRGRDVVKQVHATMEAISQSSRRIAEIVGIIDGIAFQTNLLALNAQVMLKSPRNKSSNREHVLQT